MRRAAALFLLALPLVACGGNDGLIRSAPVSVTIPPPDETTDLSGLTGGGS